MILLISVPSLECFEKSHMTALRIAISLAGQLLILENYSSGTSWKAENSIKIAFRSEGAEGAAKTDGGVSVASSFQINP